MRTEYTFDGSDVFGVLEPREYVQVVLRLDQRPANCAESASDIRFLFFLLSSLLPAPPHLSTPATISSRLTLSLRLFWLSPDVLKSH